MSSRNFLRNSIRALLAVSVLSVLSGMGAVTSAASPPASAPTNVSKETREKMAVLHEQLAACLRSEKSLDDCHTEMRKSCRDALGAQGCQPPANAASKN